MRRALVGGLLALFAAALAGCGSVPVSAPTPSPVLSPSPVPSTPIETSGATPSPDPSPTPTPIHSPGPEATPSRTPSRTSSPRQSARPVGSTPKPSLTPDPRNRFYSNDLTWYASPWYPGRHRIMEPFGCTPAPYYAPDPRCSHHEGYHHGVDIALPCGIEITAGVSGRVISPASPGTPGPAYGSTAFRIRTPAGQDVLIGHAQTVFVHPGDQVYRGERIALAGARGAPDGCHLHLEVRPAGDGYQQAVSPMRIAGLRG